VLFFFTYIPLSVLIGFFEFRKGEIKRRPMLNPYTQATIQAQILQSQGLFSYVEGNTEEAKIHLENSIEILRRWKIK
jgi:hypothetical protein